MYIHLCLPDGNKTMGGMLIKIAKLSLSSDKSIHNTVEIGVHVYDTVEQLQIIIPINYVV